MALTLEPDTRQSASAYLNISMEDFLDALDRVEPEKTPLLTLCDNAIDLGATDRAWTVDSWPSPNGALGVSDGEAAASGAIRNVVASQRKMGNTGQGFRRSYGAGWIANAVPHVAGRRKGGLITDAQADALVLLKQDMEVAFCSTDQTAVQDVGSATGSLGSGLRKMVDKANQYSAASAYTPGKPTDLHYAATAACVTGASMASGFTESAIRGVAKALRQSAASNGDYVFLAGLDLREAVTFLTDPTQATASATGGALSAAPKQVRSFTRAMDDPQFGQSVDILKTDWGRFMMLDTRFIGTTTTNSTGGAVTGDRSTRVFVENAKAGYIVKKGYLSKAWGVPPYSVELSQDGGGNKFDEKCFAMLEVLNPQYFGFFIFTG